MKKLFLFGAGIMLLSASSAFAASVERLDLDRILFNFNEPVNPAGYSHLWDWQINHDIMIGEFQNFATGCSEEGIASTFSAGIYSVQTWPDQFEGDYGIPSEYNVYAPPSGEVENGFLYLDLSCWTLMH